MCFSAAASFTSAAVIGAIGAVTLTRVRAARDLPLAATPALFAAQQAAEGFLWLSLAAAPESPATKALSLAFLGFAQLFWPAFAPLAALLAEPDDRRRRLMAWMLAPCLAVSAYLAWTLLRHPPAAQIIHDHIVYDPGRPRSAALPLPYLAAVGLPLLVSSQRALVLFGAVVLVGCVVAWQLYWQAFQSVWCYFAAAGSVVLLAHFQLARRRGLAVA